jgi:hypothetical protein
MAIHFARGFLAGVLILAACSDGGDAGTELEGHYFGDLAIDHDDVAKAIFAATDLVIASSGSVDGSTATTKSPTSIVGEVGAIDGAIVESGPARADADLEITYPTLGRFTAKGSLTFSAATGALAGMLVTRDAQGTVIGSSLLTVQTE